MRRIPADKRIGAAAAALALLTLGGLIISQSGTAGSAEAAAGGPEMVLNIKGGSCDDPVRPTECNVALSAAFTLAVEAVAVPDDGYVLMQTFVHFGSDLTYDIDSAPPPAGEIIWPDCVENAAVRSRVDQTLPVSLDDLLHNSDEVIHHGCITGLQPPLPTSYYSGNLVEFTLTCSPQATSSTVSLLPRADVGATVAGSNGALFTTVFGPLLVETVPKVSNLTINCVEPPPPVGGVAAGGELAPLAERSSDRDPGDHTGIAIGMLTAVAMMVAGGSALLAWRKARM